MQSTLFQTFVVSKSRYVDYLLIFDVRSAETQTGKRLVEKPKNRLIIVRRLLRILRLLMELLRGRLRVRLRLLRVRLLLLTGRRASIVTILLRTTRIATVLRRASTTPVALLRQHNSADTFVDWFQGRQIGGRNLDWVASHGQHNNVLPGVELVLVLDHLRSLPIILDTGSLQRKLFHFNRHGATGLRLNHCDIILGLSLRKEEKNG